MQATMEDTLRIPAEFIRKGQSLNQRIDELASEAFEGKYDSMVTVVPSHTFIWKLDDSQNPIPDYEPRNRPRRQEMKNKFSENLFLL